MLEVGYVGLGAAFMGSKHQKILLELRPYATEGDLRKPSERMRAASSDFLVLLLLITLVQKCCARWAYLMKHLRPMRPRLSFSLRIWLPALAMLRHYAAWAGLRKP